MDCKSFSSSESAELALDRSSLTGLVTGADRLGEPGAFLGEAFVVVVVVVVGFFLSSWTIPALEGWLEKIDDDDDTDDDDGGCSLVGEGTVEGMVEWSAVWGAVLPTSW